MDEKEEDIKYTLVSISPNNKYVMLRSSAEPETDKVILKKEFEDHYISIGGVEYSKRPLK
ncbi:hypothetical protein ABIE27_001999 [Paenibacillus sp. 4624]|uniref:hypothetical protein n=1 Tax=Paenibacillus sp. 4624 TaxID=3156453 RepID=UPI003D24BD20